MYTVPDFQGLTVLTEESTSAFYDKLTCRFRLEDQTRTILFLQPETSPREFPPTPSDFIHQRPRVSFKFNPAFHR